MVETLQAGSVLERFPLDDGHVGSSLPIVLGWSMAPRPLPRPSGVGSTTPFRVLGSQYLGGGAQVNELITSSTSLPWHLGQTASLSRSSRWAVTSKRFPHFWQRYS